MSVIRFPSGLLRVHAFNFFGIACVHLRLRFLGTVVPSAEPLIEGNQAVGTIVYFEMLVVQVVEIGVAIERGVFRQFQLFKADVAIDGAIACHVKLEER